ncbi:MAG TPA: DUF3768 domain-containing protein [Candidatus Saccharimonadales bacterium]|nr:DUF3768 domain-containing protein [Candidatus Saccharimonadales bacterium]
MDVDLERAAKIARLNDKFRRSEFEYMLTPGVKEIDDLSDLIKAIRLFDVFTEDNDPHHEHDFGSIEWHGEKVFWKIDYCDINSGYWRDPLDKKCFRLITVMLASEY